ncbi:hypothetical protein PQX77_013869 [Marasmius sp. AFHP31]|nr:hypothetical protein PQX77_013869 [Marasmius sp. AFHP31]
MSDDSLHRLQSSDLNRLKLRQTITATEQRDIRQLLLDAKSELGRHQDVLNRLRAETMIQETKIKELKEKMQEYQALLSPMHQLPPEILAEVFLFYCTDQPCSPFQPLVVMNITKVCRRWKEVAASSPRLWSDLYVDFDCWRQHTSQLKNLAEVVVQRSKKSPLTLTFDCKPYAPAIQVLNALECLFGSWYRWRHLDCSHTLLKYPIFQTLRHHLPALQSLRIRSQASDNSNLLFLDCRSLTSLNILPDAWVNTDLPLRQVRVLSMQTASPRAALSILQGCTNVRQLEWHSISHSGGVNDVDLDHVVLPRVQRLVAIANDDRSGTAIFENSTLRSLSTLEIRGLSPASTWNHWNVDSLKDFLLRSSCALTSLSIESSPLSDQEMISLLRLIPTLTTLRIGECEKDDQNNIITEAFFQPFSSSDNDGPGFLSSLNSLDLVVHLSSLHIQSLTHAVASRTSNIADAPKSLCRLRSVRLTVMTKEDSDMSPFSALQRHFRNAGVHVEILHKTISTKTSSRPSRLR